MRALIALLLSGCSLACAGEASLILHHGKIITVDGKFSIAEALAVEDGKIVAVGDDDAVFKLSGPKTEIVDLRGQGAPARPDGFARASDGGGDDGVRP